MILANFLSFSFLLQDHRIVRQGCCTGQQRRGDEQAPRLPVSCKTKMSIQHLTSLEWTGLKFLSLGFNALLRGSSEHYDMQVETMGEIMFDEGHQSKYIIFDPSKFQQKMYGGGHKRGEPVGFKLCCIVGYCLMMIRQYLLLKSLSKMLSVNR